MPRIAELSFASRIPEGDTEMIWIRPRIKAGSLLRLQAWRQTRKNGDHPPEQLWSEAAGLARRLGVNRVCRCPVSCTVAPEGGPAPRNLGLHW